LENAVAFVAEVSVKVEGVVVIGIIDILPPIGMDGVV
jgi:hypothetical protein